jgi:hypothetical protein
MISHGGTSSSSGMISGGGTSSSGGMISGGGTSPDAGVSSSPDPFGSPPVCTSGVHWKGGGGSPSMNPGKPCLSCHGQSGSGAPSFIIAGTVYPTGHEPDLCDGVNGSNQVTVVVTDAKGKVWNLPVNSAGNFYQPGSAGSVAFPIHAKVTRAGKERDMFGAQSTGDCNGCHTQAGANGAPGRIVEP